MYLQASGLWGVWGGGVWGGGVRVSERMGACVMVCVRVFACMHACVCDSVGTHVGMRVCRHARPRASASRLMHFRVHVHFCAQEGFR